MTTIAAFVPDLMDRSRISGASVSPVSFVALADLSELDVDVVIVDLGRVDDLPALRAALPTSRIVGFGSHVDDTMLDAARAAGIDEVLPRSVFFRRVGELLA
jgi:hypothetical protein